jgi:tetratricopeptide (TPR) repeat protein
MMFAAAGLLADDFQLLFLGGDAEFAGPRDTLLFSSQGTYRLSSSSNPPALAGNSAVSSIFNRIAKAGSETDQGRSQVMGVRGSEAVAAAEFTWVDEDSLNLEEALEAFGQEDYQRSLEILENEVDPVVQKDESAYWCYLAASCDFLGKTGPAIKIIRNHESLSYSTVYSEYLLLDGRLSIDSRNYEAASEALESYLEIASAPVEKQLACYLLGLSRLQQGEKEEGTAALMEAVSIDADSSSLKGVVG